MLLGGLVLVTGCAGPDAPRTPAGISRSATDTATVSLLRHGESIASVAGILSTAVPGQGLTEAGHAQAGRAASGLVGRGFDLIVSSPLARARETADAFATATGLPVTVLDGLAEVTAGDFEGLPVSAVAEDFLSVEERWLQGELDARIPGGESGTEFLARMDAALAQVVAAATTALVVSHGEAIRCWIALRVQDAAEVQLAPTGLVVLRSQESGWRLIEAVAAGF